MTTLPPPLDRIAISVIVPNLHSPVIGRTLESLRAQTFGEPYEIIVVGQDRHHLVQEDARTRFISTPQPVPPGVARNIGIRAARGRVLAFTDADCVADPDWLANLAARYRQPEVMVLGGSVDFPSENFWIFCENVSLFHDYLPSNPPGPRELLTGNNLSLRAEVAEKGGLFDENIPYLVSEDSNYVTRLRLQGFGLQFEPKAKVFHWPQRSLRTILRKTYHYGRGSIKVDPRFREVNHVPSILQHWWVMLLLSPLLAGSVVVRTVLVNRAGWRYWPALPVVFILKMIWCFGAAHTLRYGLTYA